MYSLVLLSVVFVISCSVSSLQANPATLRLVNVVFRHGERTPADTYPSDPHKHFDFFPYGWGQLTNRGKMQQFHQGQWLQARYKEFLGDRFSSEAVRVQSTDVDRTIMSAQLTLAGMFPPKGPERWNMDLDWQPVPIHYEPLDQDSLLLVRVQCPRYYEELARVKCLPKVLQTLSQLELQDMSAYLSSHTDMTIDNPDDVQSLYNTLLGEILFNLTIPAWTEEYFPKRMAAVTAYSFVLNAYNDELKKLKGGPLVKKVVKDIANKINKPSSKHKMFIYAGHDSTVANFMMALKVWEEQIPVYNIMALVELHEIDQIYGLKVFLRNSTQHEPFLLEIPGCEKFCPMDRFLDLTKSVIPRDFKEECRSQDSSFIPPPPGGP